MKKEAWKPPATHTLPNRMLLACSHTGRGVQQLRCGSRLKSLGHLIKEKKNPYTKRTESRFKVFPQDSTSRVCLGLISMSEFTFGRAVQYPPHYLTPFGSECSLQLTFVMFMNQLSLLLKVFLDKEHLKIHVKLLEPGTKASLKTASGCQYFKRQGTSPVHSHWYHSTACSPSCLTCSETYPTHLLLTSV